MKIIVLGATGTIGSAVADALAVRHEVVRASRHSKVRVDTQDPSSVEALFETITQVDAVVSCAGDVKEMQTSSMGAFESLGEKQLQFGFQRIWAQFRLIQLCARFLRNSGSLTLTSGQLSNHPAPGTAVASMMGCSLESLVRSAALELPRGLRVNAVSPGYVKETLEKFGMDSQPGMPAVTLAQAYVQAVEGLMNGMVIGPKGDYQ